MKTVHPTNRKLLHLTVQVNLNKLPDTDLSGGPDGKSGLRSTLVTQGGPVGGRKLFQTMRRRRDLSVEREDRWNRKTIQSVTAPRCGADTGLSRKSLDEGPSDIEFSFFTPTMEGVEYLLFTYSL